MLQLPEEKQRTINQNSALHKYFEQLAEALNSAGLDMKRTLKAEVDIPWEKNTVKQFLWKPVQREQLGKERTRDLTTKEVSKVYETLNRYLGEKHGVTVMFPSVEDILIKERKL